MIGDSQGSQQRGRPDPGDGDENSELRDPTDLSLALAPDHLGTLTGYRCWKTWLGILASPAQGDLWLPGETKGAICTRDNPENEHEAPDPNCRCGIYCYKDLGQLAEKQLWRLGASFTDPATVIGAVEIWGRVEEHEIGYRAQYARLKCIIEFDGGNRAKIRKLWPKLGAPILLIAALAMALHLVLGFLPTASIYGAYGAAFAFLLADNWLFRPPSSLAPQSPADLAARYGVPLEKRKRSEVDLSNR